MENHKPKKSPELNPLAEISNLDILKTIDSAVKSWLDENRSLVLTAIDVGTRIAIRKGPLFR